MFVYAFFLKGECSINAHQAQQSYAQLFFNHKYYLDDKVYQVYALRIRCDYSKC